MSRYKGNLRTEIADEITVSLTVAAGDGMEEKNKSGICIQIVKDVCLFHGKSIVNVKKIFFTEGKNLRNYCNSINSLSERPSYSTGKKSYKFC